MTIKLDKFERAVQVIYQMKDNVAAGLPETHNILYLGKPTQSASLEGMSPISNYTVAPSTHKVNDWEVPAPVISPLEEDQTYYIPSITTMDYYDEYSWQDTELDMHLLKNKQIFLRKEHAQRNCLAQCFRDPYGPDFNSIPKG